MSMKAIAVVGILLCAVFASAHDLTVDVIRVIQNGDKAFVSLGLHKTDPLAANPDAEVRKRLHLLQNGAPVIIGRQVSSTEKSEDLTYWQAELETKEGGEFTLEGPLRPDRKDMTTVLLVFQNGLLANQKSYKPGTEVESIGGFFRLGIEHLLAGLDHILFVLSLVLLARRFKEVAKVITAFTLAHCCTLALVVLKGVTLPPRIVEPLIALSIAIVAIEALRAPLAPPVANVSGVRGNTEAESMQIEPRRSRSAATLIAFGFGLIHGFGFAGGLIEKGFDRKNVWPALLSFNVGLELAQLSIAVMGFVAMSLLGRYPKLHGLATRCFSFAFTAIALVWFFQRIISS